MDKRTVLAKVRAYADVLLRQNVPFSKVVLFGSYAAGSARDDSDIDVAVVIPKISEGWLELSAKLFRLTRDVDLRIEPVALEENGDKSGFLEHIMATGEVVYSRPS